MTSAYTWSAAISFGLLGCSATAEGTQSKLFSCDKSTRVGTYQLTWAKQSGTCPVPPTELVRVEPPQPGKAGSCEVKSASWSEGDCRSDVAITCVTRVDDPTQYGGWGTVTTESTGYTRQTTEDGSSIDGVVTVRVSATDGAACSGTFELAYRRQ